MEAELQIKLLLNELRRMEQELARKDEEINNLKNSGDKTEIARLRAELDRIKIDGIAPLSSFSNELNEKPGHATYDTPYLREARNRGMFTVL